MDSDDGAMLFVGKLPPSCKDGDGVMKLQNLFQKYGEVTDFIFNGTHAFVHMATEAQAKEAITYLNSHKIGNALILVAIATGATAAAGRKLALENRNKPSNNSGTEKSSFKSETKVPVKSILKKAPVFQEPIGFNKPTGNQTHQHNLSHQHAERFTPYNIPNTSQHDTFDHSRGVGPIRGQSSQSMSANNSYDPLAMLKSKPGAGSDPLAGFLTELRAASAGNASSHSDHRSNDVNRSERERQAPQRGQQSSKPMGNDYDPLAMLKTAATPMMATTKTAHSSSVAPYSNDGYRSEREQTDLKGNSSVYDGRQNLDGGAMLFVGKLPPSCKDADGVRKLQNLFQKYGEVTDFIFNGTHAFVHMATEAQAKEAITYLNGHKIGNALILVAIATGATAAAGRKLASEQRNKPAPAPRVNKGPSMMATPKTAHSGSVGPYSNERKQQDYPRRNSSVHDGRQNSVYEQHSQNDRNIGPSNNQRNQRDDYNQRNQRDDYNQRNQRVDYNQRNQSDDYNQRNDYNQSNQRNEYNQRDNYDQRNQRDEYNQGNQREGYNQRDDYNQRNQRDFDSYQRNDSFYPENRDSYDRNMDRQRGQTRDNSRGAQGNNYRGAYDDVASINDRYAQSNDTFRPPRNTEYERISNEPPSRLAQVNADGKIVPKYPKREAQNSQFGCGADKLPNKNDIMAFLSGKF